VLIGGAAASPEPLLALFGSTAAFATLKVIELIAPKIEKYQLSQSKARDNPSPLVYRCT